MRRVAAALVLALMAPPAMAQGTLVARFSETSFREPTFVVSQPSYVGVFEVLDGAKVVQRFPRVEAQASWILPAGESRLGDLDVVLGRVTDAPGTRTVFWNGGGYGNYPVAQGARTTARTLILVAASRPLRAGPSAEFPARYAEAWARTDSTAAREVRTLEALLAVVKPEGAAEVATERTTLWVTDYREFRGAGVSIAANDPVPYVGTGACSGYNVGVITTYSQELACGAQPVWMGGGWATSFGAGYVPYFPIFTTVPTAPPSASPAPGQPPVGVFPGTRVTPTGPFGGSPSARVTRVPEPPVQQVPAYRTVYWSGGIAGTPVTGTGPLAGPGAPAVGGGGGPGGEGRGGVSHVAPVMGAPMPALPMAPRQSAPSAAPAIAGGHPAGGVLPGQPVAVAAPRGGAGAAPAKPGAPSAAAAPAPVKK